MDDRSPHLTGDHRPCGVLGGQHGGRRIGGEAGFPVLDVHLGDGAPVNLSCHVHDDVDLAIRFQRTGNHAFDIGFLDGIALQRRCLQLAGFQEFDSFASGVSINVGNHDAGAFASQEMRDRAADIGAAAEHDGYLALEPFHIRLSG